MKQEAAAFLTGQMDYVYFGYGLAFFLLGTVCLAWLRPGTRGVPWHLLAAAAFTHGLREWLELVSRSASDSPAFQNGRVLLLGGSYLLLLEFARGANRAFRGRAPGLWIYGALGAGVLAAGLSLGRPGLVFSIRLLLATTGAIWSGSLLFRVSFQADVPGEGRPETRRALRSAGLALCVYGLFAGLVSPAATFFPVNRFNAELFLATTGVPVQLIRGIVAVWLTVSIWVYAESLDEPGAVRRKRRIAFWLMLATLTGAQGAGWFLTDHLGRLDDREFVQHAEADAEGIQDHILAVTRSTDDAARVFSFIVSRFRLLDANGAVDTAGLDAVADEISFGGVDRVAYVLDASGSCISTSNRTRPDSFLAENYAFRPYFVAAMRGHSGQLFAVGITSAAPGYYASAPVPGPNGEPVGATVVKRRLSATSLVSAAELGLDHHGNLYFISPEGRILVSDRPEAEGRMLWPSRPGAPGSDLSPGTRPMAPLLDAETTGTEWVRANERKVLAVRRTVLSDGWSVVLLKEPATRSTNRSLGIVITLLSCALVIIGFVTIQHQYSSESHGIRKEGVLSRLNVNLAKKAETDGLTGLRNRLGFDDAMAREVERARRDGTPLSIVMLDLDEFKVVNDLHGHLAGDEVLVGAARLLERLVRQTDTVARWGGEEFMVLAPMTPLEGAARQAEKIRAAFVATPPGNVGSVTASLGVACLRPAESIAAILRRVDEALLRAKGSGRNRVESAA